MKIMSNTLAKSLALAALAVLMYNMVGCSTTPRAKPANVVDRTANASEPAPPGYYRVKKDDTLARIALDHGQAPRDVIAWNKNTLANPNQIEVGDLILVRPPTASPSAAIPAAKSADTATKADTPTTKETAKADAPTTEVVAEPGIRLSYPTKGKITSEFSEANKGIDIAGKVGNPVQAAADGKVVYAGDSLRGYGNLVIVKHDNTYLTAYAHNSRLLVKEGDTVRKGQKIAEMGDTDATSPKLHFELRVNGKPVNPTPYLQ